MGLAHVGKCWAKRESDRLKLAAATSDNAASPAARSSVVCAQNSAENGMNGDLSRGKAAMALISPSLPG